MASGKPIRISAIALLVIGLLLVLGLLGWLVNRQDPAFADKKSSSSPQANTGVNYASDTPQAPTSNPSASTPKQPPAGTKVSERKESITIKDLEKHGIFVEAEHVGKNSASGKVRIIYKGEKQDTLLEADRAKMSPNGMLVAEGNVTGVQGESRFRYSGENGAMAVYLDEKTQHVTMRIASADEVTKARDPNDPTITDPDRDGTR